ncbi:abhydrolase domain-containing protein C22H12.03 [Cucumis melo var. makuwa]|uniref:Abhydrolase domain-containing protein C22H12.03 n=1 Tax=Cucumis melo var. makuwa TaxID=1194695 RepID=A0A5A7UFJ4_CUCMM|nr:abhydrolase domain-containing protein C22H12.03 [Cucumis melo var. makuwa]
MEESLFGYDYMIATLSSLFSASCSIKKMRKWNDLLVDYMIAIMNFVFSVSIEGQTASDLSSDSIDEVSQIEETSEEKENLVVELEKKAKLCPSIITNIDLDLKAKSLTIDRAGLVTLKFRLKNLYLFEKLLVKSYEETNLYVPRDMHINFLKAERSLHCWALEDIQIIHVVEELVVEEGGGVEMHILEDASHWVHVDNPHDLFQILSSFFKGIRT